MIAGNRKAANTLAATTVSTLVYQSGISTTLEARCALVRQCFLFLLMGYDSEELRLYHDNDTIEVIPASMAS